MSILVLRHIHKRRFYKTTNEIKLGMFNQTTGRQLSCLAHAIGAGGLGFDSRAGQIYTVSPTTRHRCDDSSELCCPGAKPRRWAPQLVTRFGVIRRV